MKFQGLAWLARGVIAAAVLMAACGSDGNCASLGTCAGPRVQPNHADAASTPDSDLASDADAAGGGTVDAALSGDAGARDAATGDANDSASPAPLCEPDTRSCAGRELRECASDGLSVEVTPCTAAEYCDLSQESGCSALSSCAAGQYISVEGTATSDRECSACADGSFSTAENSINCSTLSDCGAGQRVIDPGSDSTDRQCEDCIAGTYSEIANASACSACALGAVSTTAGATACLPAQIVAGVAHTCALLPGGSVRCWGLATSGQLGYGSTAAVGDTETPASVGDVAPGATVTQLAAGGFHTCALLETGKVRCWGNGANGRLGYGNTSNIGHNATGLSALEDVNLDEDVIQITAGDAHTCALLASGSVHCWGANSAGVLGYPGSGDVGDNENPGDTLAVKIGQPVTQVVAGRSHTCALLNTGAVRCWGTGGSGRLGYGNTDNVGDVLHPEAAGDVDIGDTVTQLVAGEAHTCALLTSGDVRCWGDGLYGQLGSGSTADIGNNESPSEHAIVSLGEAVIQLAAGGNRTCALLVSGAVLCWGEGARLGYEASSNVGDDESPLSKGPLSIDGTVAQLAMGSQHSCALFSDGQLRCWGAGGSGRLGYGNVDNVLTPADVGYVPYF